VTAGSHDRNIIRLRDATANVVGRPDLFRGVDADAVAEALRDCDVRVLETGAVLLRPGAANDTIFVLLSGELAAYIGSTPTRDVAVTILPGESVGEMSAIDGKPVSALVVATAESRVLCLSGDQFWRRLGLIPGIYRNLLAALSERMRRSNEAMLESQRKRLALEYLDREMRLARELQASMIPARGRLFRERDDIEIAGIMEPASAVGGDFFDAFFVDAHRLFFCVGDVSGHGIPAALLMARTMGLIRIAAMGTRESDRLLERVNDELCAGNDAGVFVTLFCGFLDVDSGRLVHANGGHCAPLIARGGRASELSMAKGSLVGAIPGLRYAATESSLECGDTLICFTDGFVEAESPAGVSFSADRLRSIGASRSRESVEDLVEAMRLELAAFVGDRPREDDCTMLALRRP